MEVYIKKRIINRLKEERGLYGRFYKSKVLRSGDFVALVYPEGSVSMIQIICFRCGELAFSRTYIWSDKTKGVVIKRACREYSKVRRLLVERKEILGELI